MAIVACALLTLQNGRGKGEFWEGKCRKVCIMEMASQFDKRKEIAVLKYKAWKMRFC